MDHLSEKEATEIVMILGYRDMCRTQQGTGKPKTHNRIYCKFNRTGLIKDLPKSGGRKTASRLLSLRIHFIV